MTFVAGSQKGSQMDIVEPMVDTSALMARAAELIDQGRPGAARPLLAAVRGIAPPTALLSMLNARLAIADGAFDLAQMELDRALTMEPDNPDLFKSRADLRRTLGDLEGATRDAAEAVIADRHDPVAKALLGSLLLDIDRPADAVRCLREAVAAIPANPAYLEALANGLSAIGDVDAALDVLKDGIGLNPGSVALRNAAILMCIRRRDFTGADALAEQARIAGAADACTFGLRGHALSSLARHEDAAHAYDAALKLGPNDPYVRHLASAGGIAPNASRAPEDYVRTLFDGYAERFEGHLVSLGYRIPGLILRKVRALPGRGQIGGVLDLGCGTGLVALALSEFDLGPITGIDLSPKMLDAAREKGLYARLVEGSLPEALADTPGPWRLITAADLLCYFGALEELLGRVAAILAPGGHFIASVEELVPDHDGNVPGAGDWLLGRQGRYAHAAAYLAHAAADQGFEIVSLEREILREEAGGPVMGLLAVLKRPAGDA